MIKIILTYDNIALYGENLQELTEDDLIDSIKVLVSLAKVMFGWQKGARKMEMRKFIIEIHPDGTLTCCEYEDPKEATQAAHDRAWLAGYRQALAHCDEQVNTIEGLKGTCLSADIMYQGAAHVRDGVKAMYSLYAKK